MTMKLKPAFRYQFLDFLKGAAVFFLVMVAVTTATLIIAARSHGTMSFSAFGFGSVVFLFVMGIVTIRSNLRLCLQFSVSRRTGFAAALLSTVCIALLLAVAGELLMIAALTAGRGLTNLILWDVYQMIYLGSAEAPMSLGQHLGSALFNTVLSTGACLFGMFFSLMFWRLNKLWTIVAAISIPVVLNVVPWLLYRLGVDLMPLVNWMIAAPGNFILVGLAVALFFTLIDWLLLRRANIKAAVA
jgi:hypothetical protein